LLRSRIQTAPQAARPCRTPGTVDLTCEVRVQPLLVAARWTTFARALVARGATPDAGDLLHEQREFLLEFSDALPVPFDSLEQCGQFCAVA